jgi:hypothetical protein
MEWTRILAYITGTVDQELLLRNEYLAAENRILMAKLNGRPRFSDVERLITRMARENRSWGYDRIVGALANLGHNVSDQTVGNVLRRHSPPPASERKHTTTWRNSFGLTSRSSRQPTSSLSRFSPREGW